MSECTNGELRDLLPELVNGRLGAEMQRTVEAHVASCTECAEELAMLRSLRSALMRGPVIDAERIAAAVRARTASAASRAPERRGMTTPRRVAIAAAALIGLSALGYVVGTRRAPVTPDVAVVHTPSGAVTDTTDAAHRTPESSRAPVVAVPRTAPMTSPPRDVAVAPPHVRTPLSAPSVVASAGALENLSDLSDDDVRALTASLDKLSSVPDANPSPGVDPLGASLEDLSAGGS